MQFAEHPLAKEGAEVVAFVNLVVVDMMRSLMTEAPAVPVAERVIAEACGCADTVAVIATSWDVSTRPQQETCNNQPASAPW